MSKQERQARGMEDKPSRAKRTNNATFITHNANKEDLPVLAALLEDPDKIDEGLRQLLDNNVSISLSVDPKTGAYRAMVYDRDSEYDTRLYITCWASSPTRAIALAAHAALVGHITLDEGLNYTGSVQLTF